MLCWKHGRKRLVTLPALLDAVMDIYGYLPLQAAKRIVQAAWRGSERYLWYCHDESEI